MELEKLCIALIPLPLVAFRAIPRRPERVSRSFQSKRLVDYVPANCVRQNAREREGNVFKRASCAVDNQQWKWQNRYLGAGPSPRGNS